MRKRILQAAPTRTAALSPRGLRLPVIAAVLGFAAVSVAGATWFVQSRTSNDVVEAPAPVQPPPKLAPPPTPPAREVEVAPSEPSTEPIEQAAPPATRLPAPDKPKTEEPDPVTEAGMLFDATRALRHEGNPQKARRILSEYHRHFPGGAMSEEALALSIEIAQKSGDPRAKQLAERYLQRYPSGHFRSRAERALQSAP